MLADILKPISKVFKHNIPVVIRFASIDDSETFNYGLKESYEWWVQFKKPQGVNVSLTIFNNAHDYLISHYTCSYDVACSDINMPKMGGWELYEKLIENGGNAKLIIGLQSGDFSGEHETASTLQKQGLTFQTMWGLYEAFKDSVIDNRIQLVVRKVEFEENSG